MMHPYDEELKDQNIKESGKKKKKIEYTICKKIKKLKKERKKIKLVTNIIGQPIGEISIDFQTYMSNLARNMVLLSIPTLHEMPDSVLDAIWANVLQLFKGKVIWSIVMDSINKKWCDHKSKMTNNVIYRFLNNEKF